MKQEIYKAHEAARVITGALGTMIESVKTAEVLVRRDVVSHDWSARIKDSKNLTYFLVEDLTGIMEALDLAASKVDDLHSLLDNMVI